MVHFTDNSKGAVKLICKYNPSIGWYEFNVRLDGTFDIKAAVFKNNDFRYETLYEGETNKIKFNGDPNEFHADCSEDSLHIDFNESKGWAVEIPGNVPNLPSGQVGFGIQSESSLPVKIGVDQFVIEENNQ